MFRFAAEGRTTPAAAGHMAINATWPNCGASAEYPARKNPTIREKTVCPFISILLWQVVFAVVSRSFGLRSKYHAGVPVAARLCAQAAQCAIFGFCALCSQTRHTSSNLGRRRIDAGDRGSPARRRRGIRRLGPGRSHGQSGRRQPAVPSRTHRGPRHVLICHVTFCLALRATRIRFGLLRCPAKRFDRGRVAASHPVTSPGAHW
jgi:hypothetical protein